MLQKICVHVLWIIFMISQCNAKKIKLIEDRERTVTFNGDELKIQVDNPSDRSGEKVIVCLGSSVNTDDNICPKGYISVPVLVKKELKLRTVEVNRDGKVLTDDANKVYGNVRFGEDGSIQIVAAQIPEGVIVTLLNAESVISATEKPESGMNAGVIGAIVGCVAIFIVPTTKPSNEEVTIPSPTSIQPAASTPAPQVEPKPVPTNTTPVTPKTTPTTVPKPKSVKKAKSAPETTPKPKSALPTETISATTVENEKSPPIKTDKTQVATQRSLTTEPTPDFTRDGNGNALAKNSVCKARKYMHPSEAPRPGQPRRRVLPVVDEVEHFKRGTETYLCFCQRHGKLGGHNHWLLVRRIDPTGAHKPSYAERMLLKADPKDAPRWADEVVKEGKARVAAQCLYHDFEQVGYDELMLFWHWLNDFDTPASDGLLVLYKLAPELFKLQEQSLADPLIRIMPLCGIYTLILDQSFSTSFRIELAAELRNRASKVIPYIQPDALREAAFPVPYMARAFMKNNRSFVEGREIHSKSSRIE
uniref:Transmembrane protein n=1 Tax=Panagrellus redivivus TaxID=6233 RepID=A0A7E4UV73_PANRE